MAYKQVTKTGDCEGCGFRLHLSLYKKLWLCRDCMIGDEIPPRLEDHVKGECALGDLGRLDGAVPSDLSYRCSFARALDKAMAKRGWKMDRADVKEMIWVDAMEGKAARMHRWDSEPQEQEGS